MTRDSYPHPTDTANQLAGRLYEAGDTFTDAGVALDLLGAGLGGRRDLLVRGRFMLDREYDLLNGATEDIHGEKELLTSRLAQASRQLILDERNPHNAWNFLVETEAYIDNFATSDRRVGALAAAFARQNVPLSGALQYIGSKPEPEQLALSRTFLEGPISDDAVLAGHMLARAELRQGYISAHYGETFNRDRHHMARYLGEVLPRHGVGPSDMERISQQLNATKLAAQDFLHGDVSSADGLLGDYMGGTFKVHVQLGGNTQRPAETQDFSKTARHELTHAASVQQYEPDELNRGNIRIRRVGLRVDGIGTAPNEAVVDFLSRASDGNGFPLDLDKLYDNYIYALLQTQASNPAHLDTIIQGTFCAKTPDNINQALGVFYHNLAQLGVRSA